MDYIEINNLLVRQQAAFSKTSRTTDYRFILNKIIDEAMKTKDGRPYSCFVDIQKAFNNVWQEALLLQLRKIGVGRK